MQTNIQWQKADQRLSGEWGAADRGKETDYRRTPGDFGGHGYVHYRGHVCENRPIFTLLICTVYCMSVVPHQKS